jgi:hypothetical protein
MIVSHNGTIGYIWQNGGITPHITHQTKMTPFEALYGYPPPKIKEYVVSNFKAPAVKNYLATSDEILRVLKTHLETSKESNQATSRPEKN